MKEIFEKNKQEIIVVLIFVFFALGYNIYRVQSDGVVYYAFLEHMLHIPNPETPYTALENAPFSQAGCAFFNAPFYLIAYAFEGLFHIHWNFNGITLRQVSINLASNFYMISSLLLVIGMLKKIKFRYVITPVCSVLFSTSAFAAAVIIPSFSHAADIFIWTLFIYLVMENEKSYPAKSFWLGILAVVAILVRYLNFVLVIALIIYYLTMKEYKKIKYLLIGFLATAWIIPLIFYIYNSTISPLSNTGFTAAALGKRLLLPRHFLKFLIHPLHGLFIWSPVTILSVLGLLGFVKEKKKIGYLFLGIWFLFLIMHSFLYEWHAGWSFSNRYLVSLFPIYIIGLAAFLEKFSRRKILLVVILTVYSIILFLNWHQCIMNGEFGTPQDMVKAWIKGESATSMDKKVNVKTFLNRSWQMCRYKYLLRILK